MLTPNGYEIPDNTPVEIPTRLRLPPNRILEMRALIRQEMSAEAALSGHETFEESDDFDLPDVDRTSPFENEFEPKLSEDPFYNPAKPDVQNPAAAGPADQAGKSPVPPVAQNVPQEPA